MYGPGYRLYYIEHRDALIFVWGGHKGTQTADVERARRLADNYLQEESEGK